MVNVLPGPGQPLAVGLTVIVAVRVEAPLLFAVNEGIFPVPFAASPIAGVVFIQL